MLLNIPDTAKEMRGYRGVEWGGQGDEGRSPEVPIMLLKFHYKGSLYLPLLCSLPLWLTLTPSASSVGHIYLHVSPPPFPSQSGSHPFRIPPVETREGRRRISRWCGEMEVRRGTSEGPVLHLGKVSEVWWDMGGSWLHCTATVCGIPSLITPLISQRNKWLLSSAPTLIACTLAHNVPPLRATIQSLCLPSAL